MKRIILTGLLLLITSVAHAQSFYEKDTVYTFNDSSKLEVHYTWKTNFYLTDPSDPDMEPANEGWTAEDFRINGNDVILGPLFETFTVEEMNRFAEKNEYLLFRLHWDSQGHITKIYFFFNTAFNDFMPIEPQRYMKLYKLYKDRIKMNTQKVDFRFWGYININFKQVINGELLLDPFFYDFQ